MSFNEQLARTDYSFESMGQRYRASLIHILNIIVYTNVSTGIGDKIKLEKPFPDTTPQVPVIRNEVLNHMKPD